MKKLLTTLLGALAFAAVPAYADTAAVTGPENTLTMEEVGAAPSLYNCQLRGSMSGFKLGFILGGQYLSGRGMIRCTENARRNPRTVNMPVSLRIAGGGVGFDLTIVKRVNIITAGIGAVRRPRDLTGQFNVAASAGLTLIRRGYNVQSAISVKHRGNGLAFEVGFQGERAYGLGARLHGLVMTVRPL